MSETWKGKTRGGIFGYMFFIYMIRCLGITAAYGFLALVVLYFIPFAPKATGNTWSYARNRLKYGRLKSVALLLKNYYRLGQILIDKVAIGNGELSGIFRRTKRKHRSNYDWRPCGQLGNRRSFLR